MRSTIRNIETNPRIESPRIAKNCFSKYLSSLNNIKLLGITIQFDDNEAIIK